MPSASISLHRERTARADDERVRGCVRAERVCGLVGADPDPAPLAGREAPDAVVPTDLGPALVDDRPCIGGQTLPLEEGAIVGAGEEAGLLALLPARHGQPGRGRLVARRLLSLAAERERDPVEQPRVDGGEHVRLILGGVGAAGDEPDAVALDDPGVVPRPEDLAAGPGREVDEDVEAEVPVAAHAGVRRQPRGVAVDERRHDLVPEALAEVEGDVREAEPMAGLPRRDHRLGRAAHALGARPGGIEPEAQRDADGVRRRAEERDGAVDAAAHRNGDPARCRLGGERRADRVRECVGRERLAGDGSGLEQRQPLERLRQAGGVGLDDPVAVDEQPHGGVLGAAGGVADQLSWRHCRRLDEAIRPAAARVSADRVLTTR